MKNCVTQPLHITAIILAAGTGSRMKLGYNKVLFEIDVPIVVHAIAAFEHSSVIDTIVVVAAEGEIETMRALVEQAKFTKVSAIICGGASRQESSRRGVESVSDADIIAIHDAARPLVTEKTIAATIAAAQIHGASIAAVPIKDTLKVIGDGSVIEKTLDRRNIYSAQTPQTFRADHYPNRTCAGALGSLRGNRRCLTRGATWRESHCSARNL